MGARYLLPSGSGGRASKPQACDNKLLHYQGPAPQQILVAVSDKRCCAVSSQLERQN